MAPHETADRYVSPRFSRSHPNSRRSLTDDQVETSDYKRNPLFVTELSAGTLRKRGSLQRRDVAIVENQPDSMLAEVSVSTINISSKYFLKLFANAIVREAFSVVI